MPVITIKLDEKEYRELKEKALNEGFESVAEYIKKLIFQKEEAKMPQSILRTVQDMINPFTAKVDELARSYGEIIEKLEKVEEKVERLEETTSKTLERPYRRTPSRKPSRKTAIDRLREEGAVFQSELSWLNNPKAFFNKLRREGAIVIDDEKEMIAVDPEFWEEFVSEITMIGEENVSLVEKKLGGKKKVLFKKLVDKGIIFYDKLENRWSVSI